VWALVLLVVLGGVVALLFFPPLRPKGWKPFTFTREVPTSTQSVATGRAPTPPVAKAEPAAVQTNAITPLLRPVTITNTAGYSTNRFANAVLEAQIALTRVGISPGSIDGSMGSQTRAALRAWQRREGLPITGELDSVTRPALVKGANVLTTCVVTAEDLQRLRPLSHTWLGKSLQDRLDYETILELVAERAHASPNLIRRLNTTVNWPAVKAGTEVIVPFVQRDPPANRAAYLQIRLSERTLQAFSYDGRLLAHFPCSIAARMDKRPVGQLQVVVTAPNPNYTFNPEVFPESAEARELGRKLVLPPGPNNPVGTVWIGLDRPGYGIHGTPKPEEVGRTESHGCFRLANWNAEYLLQLVSVGTPVHVEP
jgi:peptidoglycan hydrolase-like protein with peptidoglycan-binding domain